MKLWENVEGAWLFLLKLTETAPLSVWTFVVAAILPAVLVRYLHRFPCMPRWERAYGKPSVAWGVETIALIAGIGISYLPWQTLPGLLIGICAGLLSPYLCKGGQLVGGIFIRWATKRFG